MTPILGDMICHVRFRECNGSCFLTWQWKRTIWKCIISYYRSWLFSLPSRKLTDIYHLGKRNIIDSERKLGIGYLSSQEGTVIIPYMDIYIYTYTYVDPMGSTGSCLTSMDVSQCFWARFRTCLHCCGSQSWKATWSDNGTTGRGGSWRIIPVTVAPFNNRRWWLLLGEG